MNVEATPRKAKRAGGMLASGSSSYDVIRPRLFVIGIVAVLMALGLVMVYSASSVTSFSDGGDASSLFEKQLVMCALGIAAAAVVIWATPRFWSPRTIFAIWVFCLVLLVFTYFAGYVGFGAKRWLPILGFSFQPSEFAKIAMMLLAADLVTRYRNGQMPGGLKGFHGQLALCIILPAGIIILQPDLGTTIVAAVSTFTVLWFGGLDRKWVCVLLVAGAAVVVFAICFAGFRGGRIVAWLNPESDPYGVGYQSLNSYYALANGGFFGTGLGNSALKYNYLTQTENDFIFAIIGEELGFLGAIAVIALFIGLSYFSFQIGRHANSRFGMLICNASAVTITFQALLNIACVTGVLPVTGKPLPFISYGGSSMISTMILVGIILSVSFKDSADGSASRRRAIKVRSQDGAARR